MSSFCENATAECLAWLAHIIPKELSEAFHYNDSIMSQQNADDVSSWQYFPLSSLWCILYSWPHVLGGSGISKGRILEGSLPAVITIDDMTLSNWGASTGISLVTGRKSCSTLSFAKSGGNLSLNMSWNQKGLTFFLKLRPCLVDLLQDRLTNHWFIEVGSQQMT